jgi:uncharacterized membrane protein
MGLYYFLGAMTVVVAIAGIIVVVQNPDVFFPNRKHAA